MKFINLTLVFIAILVALFFYLNRGQTPMPNYIILADTITSESVKKMTTKYDMRLIGFGGAMMECVEGVSLRYCIERIITKEDARNIMMDCIIDLTHRINANLELRPHLWEFPFPEKRLSIVLFIHESRGLPAQHPNLNTAHFYSGKIVYTTSDNNIDEVSSESETLEEAKKLVNLQL